MELSDLLPLLNEWWQTGEVGEDLARPYRRIYFDELMSLLDRRQMVIVTGLRRVGKTTLMYQAMEELIRSGVDPIRVLYFSFDQEVRSPLDVFREYRKLTGIDWRRERVYVFLDEVQKLGNWSTELKTFYDSHPGIKFVLSGSAGLQMEADAVKNLAGRYFAVDMLPLTLKEFTEMHLGRRIENPHLFKDEMDYLFPKFVRRPFPEILDLDDEMRVLEYVRSIVLERIIYMDLPQVKKGFRPDLALRLLSVFMSEPGMIFNADAMSRDMGVSKSVLLDHMQQLEFARLIRLVKNFRPSARAESRKRRRVYPYHIALAFPFRYRIDEGKVFESLVATYLDLRYYWRDRKKEIDFLYISRERIIPIEVKSTLTARSDASAVMRRFLEDNRLKNGYVIYGGRERYVREMDGITITHLPLFDVLWEPGLISGR